MYGYCTEVQPTLVSTLFGPGVHELLAHGAVLGLCAALAGPSGPSGGGLVVWVGHRCWPYPPALGQALLECSVFVAPPTRAERLWAIDVALRSPAVAVVVADGRGLSLANSRRLQLACEAGGAMGLVVRPARERTELSAATTRWLVSPGPVDPAHPIAPTWTLELLRRKGLRPVTEGARRMAVRAEDATRLVCFDAHAADRPAATARPRPATAARWG